MSLIEFDGCHSCTLRKEWPYLRSPKMIFTPPIDPDPFRAMILGEAPGDNEDMQGKQFVGLTGQYLRDRIPDKWRHSCYFQNVVRCQPPKNRQPFTTEIRCCSTYLEEDLLKIKPQAILGLGGITLQYFWPDFNKGISKARGIPFPVKLNDGTTSWFMPAFHPSYPSRADKKDRDGNIKNVIEPVFRNDILKFFSYINTKFRTPPKVWEPPDKKTFLRPKSLQEALNMFDLLGPLYAIDFETFKTKPYVRDAKPLTVSLSDGKTTFGLPVCWPGDLNPFGLEFVKKIVDSDKEWICQSGGMEYLWIRYLTGKRPKNFHDTEVVARLLHDRKGLGALEHTTKIYLGVNIKSLSPNLDKNRMAEYPLDHVLPYNCYDSWSTFEVFMIMMQQLIERGESFVENYFRTIDTIKSTVEMEVLGLDLDINQSELMQKRLYDQQTDLRKKSRSLAEIKEFEKRESTIFNISSPDEVGHVLVDYCGLQLPKNEESQYYSTDEDNLTPLIGQHPLVDLTLDYREVAKQLSTYVLPILNGIILGVDGKLHPAYKTLHTWTWRLSSELPNIQNWPKRKNKEIRSQIIPPPGHLLVACDYGGLEARTIQMASQDQNLLNDLIDPHKYLNDIDLHWYWLHRILKLYPHYIDRLADKSGEKEEKKILKAGRTIIKTDYVFATFYGSVPESVAARTMLPLEIVQEVHKEFWGRYTNVRKWVEGQFKLYQDYGYVSSLTGRLRADVLPGNEVTNTPIQGTGAEIVLEAQNALYRRGIEEDIYFLPRVNVHDDLTCIIPDNNDSERYINVIMEDMVTPRFPFISCPLLVECSVGDRNWAEMTEIAKMIGGAWGQHTKGVLVN